MSAGRPLEFLDTNVIVYALDPTDARKHQLALSLLARLWQRGTASISVQVMLEVYNAGSRPKSAIDSSALRSRIRDLSYLTVFAPEAADVLQAIALHERHQVSIWDAMIQHAAQALGCKTVWSEDLNHGQMYGSVQVLNPFK